MKKLLVLTIILIIVFSSVTILSYRLWKASAPDITYEDLVKQEELKRSEYKVKQYDADWVWEKGEVGNKRLNDNKKYTERGVYDLDEYNDEK